MRKKLGQHFLKNSLKINSQFPIGVVFPKFANLAKSQLFGGIISASAVCNPDVATSVPKALATIVNLPNTVVVEFELDPVPISIKFAVPVAVLI